MRQILPTCLTTVDADCRISMCTGVLGICLTEARADEFATAWTGASVPSALTRLGCTTESEAMDEADRIWNRALERGRTHERAGDIALAAALGFHSSAMSGGVLDAVEGRTAESLSAAESAFTWLGLESVAQIIADVRSEIDAGALDDDERAEQIELSADERYNAIIPSDAALHSAFRVRLVEMPEAFSAA